MSMYRYFSTNAQIVKAYQDNPKLVFEMAWPSQALMKADEPMPYKRVRLINYRAATNDRPASFNWETENGGFIQSAPPKSIRAPEGGR